MNKQSDNRSGFLKTVFAENKEFYPTPDELLEKMFLKMKLHCKEKGFECDDLDCDSFPEAALLGMLLSDSEVEYIDEFFVYTGEEEEPEINPEKILSLSFCVEGKMIDIPGNIIQKYEFTR